jgi:hypothetical protein
MGRPIRQPDFRWRILPAPPLEELRVALTAAGEVDRAPEHIEHATVHALPAHGAEPLVHGLGILSGKILDLLNPQIPEHTGQLRSHAWDGLERSQGFLSGHPFFLRSSG